MSSKFVDDEAIGGGGEEEEEDDDMYADPEQEGGEEEEVTRSLKKKKSKNKRKRASAATANETKEEEDDIRNKKQKRKPPRIILEENEEDGKDDLAMIAAAASASSSKKDRRRVGIRALEPNELFSVTIDSPMTLQILLNIASNLVNRGSITVRAGQGLIVREDLEGRVQMVGNICSSVQLQSGTEQSVFVHFRVLAQALRTKLKNNLQNLSGCVTILGYEDKLTLICHEGSCIDMCPKITVNNVEPGAQEVVAPIDRSSIVVAPLPFEYCLAVKSSLLRNLLDGFKGLGLDRFSLIISTPRPQHQAKYGDTVCVEFFAENKEGVECSTPYMCMFTEQTHTALCVDPEAKIKTVNVDQARPSENAAMNRDDFEVTVKGTFVRNLIENLAKSFGENLFIFLDRDLPGMVVYHLLPGSNKNEVYCTIASVAEED